MFCASRRLRCSGGGAGTGAGLQMRSRRWIWCKEQGNVIRLEKLSAEKIQLEEERPAAARLTESRPKCQCRELSVQSTRASVEERQARLKEIQEN